MDRRLRDGKNVRNNSGNYVAGIASVFGPALAKSDNITVADVTAILGTTWGIQRNYGKRFIFNISIGPGIEFSKDKAEFAPVGGIGLGFKIGN